eukprot:scaffold106920_cov25-Tisochrysis_lutea.AAC.1
MHPLGHAVSLRPVSPPAHAACSTSRPSSARCPFLTIRWHTPMLYTPKLKALSQCQPCGLVAISALAPTHPSTPEARLASRCAARMCPWKSNASLQTRLPLHRPPPIHTCGMACFHACCSHVLEVLMLMQARMHTYGMQPNPHPSPPAAWLAS